MVEAQRSHAVRPVGRGVPQLPHHLLEPAYLEVSAECHHPLQPAPRLLRTFVCGKVFRRDEVCAHLQTVHQDIMPGLASGWLLARCPLAWLGCSWACQRRAPHSTKFRLLFSHPDDNFVYTQVEEGPCSVPTQQDHLSLLPPEVLEFLCSYLEPVSLRALSLTCLRLREVCRSLLPQRGCVEVLGQELSHRQSLSLERNIFLYPEMDKGRSSSNNLMFAQVVWQRQQALGQRRRNVCWVEASLKWTYSSSIGKRPGWREIGEGEVQHHLQTCR